MYAIMHIQQKDDDYQAMTNLIKKHRLEGHVDEWLPGYKAEMDAVISRRCRELKGDEYNRVMKCEKIVRLRMNPEPKKGGRKKCRLLVRGYQEPKEWDGKTDSPTALASTIKMLVAMGFDVEVDSEADPDDEDVITIGDISTAFLFGKEYSPDDKPRYVAYKAHKEARLRVFQLMGPLYGQRDAGYRWWQTLTEWLVSEGYTPSKNDKCLFHNPKTKMNVAAHVDDMITRGKRSDAVEFWEKVSKRFAVKEWGVVEYDNPLVYTGINISKVKYDNQVWYTMDQQAEIAEFISESNV